jgi:hypothetical protein
LLRTSWQNGSMRSFRGWRLVAGSTAKDPAHEGLQILLVFKEEHINGFEARSGEHGSVALTVTLSLGEENRRGFVLRKEVGERLIGFGNWSGSDFGFVFWICRGVII